MRDRRSTAGVLEIDRQRHRIANDPDNGLIDELVQLLALDEVTRPDDVVIEAKIGDLLDVLGSVMLFTTSRMSCAEMPAVCPSCKMLA